MSETPQEAPRIEFPCEDYPIKVIGDAVEGFRDMVISVMRKFDPTLDIAKVAVRESSNGRFLTVQVHILATSEAQLKEIHEALKETGHVHMVL